MVVGVVETTFRRIVVGKTAGLIINIIIVSKELSSAFSFVLLLFKGVFEKRTRFAKKRLLKKLSLETLLKTIWYKKRRRRKRRRKKRRKKKKKKKKTKKKNFFFFDFDFREKETKKKTKKKKMEEEECEMVCEKFSKVFFRLFSSSSESRLFFFSSSSSLLLEECARIHPALFSRGFRRGGETRRERERERPKATKSASVVVYVVVLFERAALKKELFSRSSELY